MEQEAGQAEECLSRAWTLVHTFVERMDPPGRAQDTGAWQKTDVEVQAILAAYQARGVVELEWLAGEQPCEQCLRNAGQRVKVGEPFKTGAFTVTQHPHCICRVREYLADGSSQIGYGIGMRGQDATDM